MEFRLNMFIPCVLYLLGPIFGSFRVRDYHGEYWFKSLLLGIKPIGVHGFKDIDKVGFEGKSF